MNIFFTKDSSGYTHARVGRIIIGVLSLIIVLTLFFGSFAFVGAGEVGVVTRFSAVNRVATPGLIFKIPLIESVHSMNTRIQKDQVDAHAASKDLQTVSSTIAVNYHLNGEKAVAVFQNIGENYQDTVVSPAIQESFKATTAKFTAEQLINQRESVRAGVQDLITEKMAPYNIVVDNFNIVNFDFSPEFNAAIEAKQVASQQVETAKQKLAQAEVDAKTAVAKAQGQADAQKALKDSGSLTPEYLQFLALQSWDGKLPLYTSGTPFITIPTR
jgi:regulator of protease activity HflC (stomatin/prohibitin superfamily)